LAKRRADRKEERRTKWHIAKKQEIERKRAEEIQRQKEEEERLVKARIEREEKIKKEQDEKLKIIEEKKIQKEKEAVEKQARLLAQLDNEREQATSANSGPPKVRGIGGGGWRDREKANEEKWIKPPADAEPSRISEKFVSRDVRLDKDYHSEVERIGRERKEADYAPRDGRDSRPDTMRSFGGRSQYSSDRDDFRRGPGGSDRDDFRRGAGVSDRDDFRRGTGGNERDDFRRGPGGSDRDDFRRGPGGSDRDDFRRGPGGGDREEFKRSAGSSDRDDFRRGPIRGSDREESSRSFSNMDRDDFRRGPGSSVRGAPAFPRRRSPNFDSSPGGGFDEGSSWRTRKSDNPSGGRWQGGPPDLNARDSPSRARPEGNRRNEDDGWTTVKK